MKNSNAVSVVLMVSPVVIKVQSQNLSNNFSHSSFMFTKLPVFGAPTSTVYEFQTVIQTLKYIESY